MLADKNALPLGSTLVALTDKNEVNNCNDSDKMSDFIDGFKADLSAYNLLQLYLSKCLKNRFHPHIGISGSSEYSLDDLFRQYISKPLDFDYSHFENVGVPDNYKKVFNKIVTSKRENNIYASEYGMVLSIILNDLKNKGYLNNNIDNVMKR